MPLPRCAEEDVALLATRALLAELETYPKPGLVSPVDAGSHDDMDAAMFRRSAAAIAPFFARLAAAGAAGVDLPELRAIGLDAEAAMLSATGGVNTHRGAIFALGLLCAAVGAGARDPAAHVRDAWGATLAGERPAGSHGARAMARFGIGGARGEAAAGFPTASRIGLPALRAGRRMTLAILQARRLQKPSLRAEGEATLGWKSRDLGSLFCEPLGGFASLAMTGLSSPTIPEATEESENAARVQAFFALLAVCDDTNLLHRGGAEGLAFARSEAAAFLEAGGVGAEDWYGRAGAVHDAFVARRLSPGGSADLLAVTLLLDAMDAR